MSWSSKKKCIKKTLIIAQFAPHWSNLMCPSQIPGISSWMIVHQCLGSGFELRKSSVLSEGVYQSDVSCEMFWSSSSRRKVADIDKCCRNMESSWAVRVRSWSIVSGMNCGNLAAPTASYFDFSVSLHWSSISSIWRLVGAFSTLTAKGLLSSSNLHFWTSKSANRRLNSAPSTLSFSVLSFTYVNRYSVSHLSRKFLLSVFLFAIFGKGFHSDNCSLRTLWLLSQRRGSFKARHYGICSLSDEWMRCIIPAGQL